jgi:AAA domain
MKIDGLRVAAFCRFSDPVAIEDFSVGVNVLAGPNEMGKSTFFRALEAAFITRHKVSGAALDLMRPFSGGEPLVEVDFTLSGQRWRISKQFGRKNAAVLTDLDAGRVVARNAEAEEHLGKLIGRPGDLPGPLGLVWVRQQRTLHAPDPDFDPATGKERARGEESALQQAIEKELDLAAGGDVFDRVQSLTVAALDLNLTPTRNSARKNGPLDQARQRLQDTAEMLALAERAASMAERRIQDIVAASAQLSELNTPGSAGIRTAELAKLETDFALQVRSRTDFDLARETLSARTSEANSARQTLEAYRSRLERLATLRSQHAEAESLEAVVAKLAGTINGNGATPQFIETLVKLERERDVAAATHVGNTSHVEIALIQPAARNVRVDGEILGGDTSRDVAESMVISIDGIATISVTAAGAERAASAKLRQLNAEAEMSEKLKAIAAADLGDAHRLAGERSRAVDELGRARAKLSGIAAHGAAALASEINQLTTSSNEQSDCSILEAEVRTRDADVDAARRKFDTLKASVLNDDAFRQLSARLTSDQREQANAESEIARLSMRIENLKSEQAGADEEGRAGLVAACNGKLELDTADVKRMEADGMALLLLDRTLKGIEAKARNKLFEPVVRRLAPHLRRLFGSAELNFKDAFAIDGLTRDGQRQDFAVLSDGTREQVSVLVRLAFAELLASQGMPVPLVLDDPLVYSDDERLAKVFGALEAAAEKLQVVVLTCRESAFGTLSGHRLSLTAWRPDA